MSSHREAPEISKDPCADNTDTYAFVSPDRPDTVTIITNYIPLEDPAGGPNFFEFGDDVLYEINIDNDNDGKPEITYEFAFTTRNTDPNTFLYNTGPIDRIDSPNFNRSSPTRCMRSRAAAPAPRPRPVVATVQRGHPLDAELPGARQRRDLRPGRRHQGFRRSAARRVLGRPRLDLRSCRAASVPEPAPHPHGRLPPGSTRCVRSTCTRSRSRSRSAA